MSSLRSRSGSIRLADDCGSRPLEAEFLEEGACGFSLRVGSGADLMGLFDGTEHRRGSAFSSDRCLGGGEPLLLLRCNRAPLRTIRPDVMVFDMDPHPAMPEHVCVTPGDFAVIFDRRGFEVLGALQVIAHLERSAVGTEPEALAGAC